MEATVIDSGAVIVVDADDVRVTMTVKNVRVPIGLAGVDVLGRVLVKAGDQQHEAEIARFEIRDRATEQRALFVDDVKDRPAQRNIRGRAPTQGDANVRTGTLAGRQC